MRAERWRPGAGGFLGGNCRGNEQELHFLKKTLFIFREGKGERKGEKHQCVVASPGPPTGDLAHNPGVCPDWESNR